MTDARLQSTKPIDDEIPFADAEEREAAPREDALVKPATADRDAKRQDPDIEPSALDAEPAEPGELGAP
jgi:hypothetical protein